MTDNSVDQTFAFLTGVTTERPPPAPSTAAAQTPVQTNGLDLFGSVATAGFVAERKARNAETSVALQQHKKYECADDPNELSLIHI